MYKINSLNQISPDAKSRQGRALLQLCLAQLNSGFIHLISLWRVELLLRSFYSLRSIFLLRIPYLLPTAFASLSYRATKFGVVRTGGRIVRSLTMPLASLAFYGCSIFIPMGKTTDLELEASDPCRTFKQTEVSFQLRLSKRNDSNEQFTVAGECRDGGITLVLFNRFGVKLKTVNLNKGIGQSTTEPYFSQPIGDHDLLQVIDCVLNDLEHNLNFCSKTWSKFSPPEAIEIIPFSGR